VENIMPLSHGISFEWNAKKLLEKIYVDAIK
jgi:hypothetical protein